MDFLGKVYNFDREENFDEFLKTIGIPDEHIESLLNHQPSSQLVQEGDQFKYINSTPEGTKETVFEPDVEIDDVISGVLPTKTVYSIDGNKVTQVVSSSKGSATFVREYTEDELKVTVTSSEWDGVAYRYYKA